MGKTYSLKDFRYEKPKKPLMLNLNLIEKITRNAARCNNRDDLANLGFILKVSVFSEAYLEPSRPSMMKLCATIPKSC